MSKSCLLCAMIRAAAGLVGLWALTAASTFAAEAPDSTTLFYNAQVFTAEPNAPYAEAVAIQGDRILAVGSQESATIAGASDWPVSSANPFDAMYQAETRVGPQGVLDAGQRMPREAMLYSYIRNCAKVLNQLDEIGSIAAGKRADLVLVDRDVLTVPVAEVKDAKLLWTMFGGRIVYGAGP